jgi:EmrB/QacA subfamily drug resistance transporter
MSIFYRMIADARAIRLSFAALVLAMLPAVLDQTILASGLPTIAADLGRLGDVSLLVSAYVVAATAATPLWGKLGDRFGHRAVLRIALAWFVSASAVCAAAQDITQLTILRAVQGVSAGGLMTLAMAGVSDLVEPRRRSQYQGYVAATFAAATALGPLVGGLLVDHAGWRWVFLVNLPVGALALAALRDGPASARENARPTPLDVPGAILLAGATTAFVLACAWGGGRYPWTSPEILGLGTATLAMGAALAVRERRAADPIVPLRLLSTPAVAVASSALFFSTASLFAITVFVPLFLQVAAGSSPTQAGLLLVPMTVATTISTTLAGRRIARTGRLRRIPVAGLAMMASALALLAALAHERSALATACALAVFGLGFGLVTQVLVVAVHNSVDRRLLGTATATTGFFRALGGAVGAAALGAIFSAQAGAIRAGGAPSALPTTARTDVVDGVTLVFVCAAPLAVIAALLVLRLPAAADPGPASAVLAPAGATRS